MAEPTAKGLASAVSRAVRDGVLAAGDRLPPIRELAHELALSPTTVSASWALLARAGTLRTEGRRGTVVADAAAPRHGRYRQALEHQAGFTLDLSTGIPDARLLPGLGARSARSPRRVPRTATWTTPCCPSWPRCWSRAGRIRLRRSRSWTAPWTGWTW